MPPSPSPELCNANVFNPSADIDDKHGFDVIENDSAVKLDKDKELEDENNGEGIADQNSDGFHAEHNTSNQFQPVTLFEPLSLSTIYDGKPFAELVRTWETYIGDHAADQFQPLLNNICGAGQALAQMGRPMALKSGINLEGQASLSEPFPLRHIQSTPLVHTPSILDDDEDEQPPIGLEILSRSRSTPLTTSANSAFGIILRPSLPEIHGQCDRSAFTLPPYRLKPSPLKESRRNSIFNPITTNNDMETTEQTAIEVMDILPSIPDESAKESIDGGTKSSRAAQFLSDVCNLGRRIRVRDGRENPAQPTSVSEESITKLADPSGGKDDKSLTTCMNLNALQSTDMESDIPNVQDQGMSLDVHRISHNSYTVSNVDYRTAEIPVESHVCPTGRVRIQITNAKGSGEAYNDRMPYSSTSPEPSHLTHDGFSLTPQSHDSPETFRSSGTTATSGHTTQGTATTYSSGMISHLSVISETDLEVIQVNRAGQVFRSYNDQIGKDIPVSSTAPTGYPGYIDVSDNPSSLREGASNPTERFFTMAESPIDKRAISTRIRTASSLRRSNTVNSPNTLSSSSLTTNSSGSTRDEPPKFVSYLDRKTTSDLTSLREMDERSSPRQGDRMREDRGSSPAELVGYSDVTFEEAQAPFGSKARPRPIWPTKGFQLGRKVRSLPPRSPHKGSITPTTPPPRGGGASPCYDAVSPPRHIVDHRIDPNVSRPYVLRSTPSATTRLLSAHKVAPEVLSAHGSVSCAHIPDVTTEQLGYEVVRMGTGMDFSNHYYMTRSRGTSPLSYQEQSIEVQKADSKEEGC